MPSAVQFGQCCLRSVQRKRSKDHVLVELQLSIFGDTVFSRLISPSASSEFPILFTRFHSSHCTAHAEFTKMHNCPDKMHAIWAHLHILFSHCTCNFICMIFSHFICKKQIKTQRHKSVHFLDARAYILPKYFPGCFLVNQRKTFIWISYSIKKITS